MAVKLVLFLLLLAIVLSLVVLGAFWYFNQESEREHEKTMEEIDRIYDNP